ncbi:hypothetical protein BRADI_4g42465v3 [Brachypodium distachyon]|uniref:Uncharacterized protein n=1 Tax=Brachypodium distachyon TaxID=15368 RepID=A0A0Q3HVD3_BRADI|nr:hypothetical protein BRADI_4g42465v3 [Brachypodium distachyon]
MAKAAAALLPGLLQTPPPMSTPAPCIIILPAASNPKFPKPGRADAVERWDAHKNDGKKPGSPASSSCGSTSTGRADSVERWDINKKKKPITSSTSSSSSSSSSIRDDSNKRPPSRASSADLWDAHKKPRAAAQPDGEQEEQKKTIVVDKEAPKDKTTLKKMIPTEARSDPVFSGPSFVASPEPGMLPMPAFFPRRAGVLPLPAFVQAQ